jgi:hypothetical protein
MGRVLCATRGGEESEQTQAAAIELARQQGHELVFLYEADVSFLNRIAAPVVVDVERELERMGRFQLALAREQAAAQGVEAQAVVRRGHLHSELVAAARDLAATLVILGRPREGTPVFDEEALNSFVAHLQSEAGVEVRIL